MDDLERDLRGMLNDRVSGMPDAYDAAPEVIARSHRRRVSKLTAIGVGAVVVAAGVTGAVVRSVGGSDAHRLSTSPSVSTTPPSTPTTPAAHPPGVAVLGCPVVYGLNGGQKLPPPASNARGRIPAAGDPAQLANLASFGATSDPRYVVLGPMTWSCLTTLAADGSSSVVVYDPAKTPGMVPDVSNAPIAVLNDYLWHGGVGSGYACSVFSDAALVQYVSQNYPQEGPCPRAGRVVTRVDAHMSTFVDADGVRGVGWITLPSSAAAEDGKLTVLTCRPTAGLTAAACDTIIAEFEARANAPRAPG